MARFATVWPARSTFSVDTSGLAVSLGNAVTNPHSIAVAMVRLTTTATTGPVVTVVSSACEPSHQN